jgi:hypothetical protein
MVPDIEKFLSVAIFKMAVIYACGRRYLVLMITRYDYNLTIMKSPKPATENRLTFFIKSYLWNRTMFNFSDIAAAILKMETGRNFSMSSSGNGSWHRKISIGRHFQNGRHNTAQVQHCSISTSWIDFRHWKISTGLHILKMATGRNFSMSGIISGHHNLPTYEMALKSDNVEFVRYCRHFICG